MPHASLKLIPGVDQNRTLALNEAAISESNLIRFMPDRNGQGLPQKLGGWTKFIPRASWGVVRALNAWSDTNKNNYLGIGADDSLWVSDVPSSAIPISPQYYTANIPVYFSTTLGSSEVVITDTGSNITSLDSIYIETPVSVGGLVLSGFYTCEANGANTYSIVARNVIGSEIFATATVSNGGDVPTFTSTITPSPTSQIKVTLADHGYSVGSTFPIMVSTKVGGVTLYGDYIVASIISPSQFSIVAPSTPTNALPILSASWSSSTATIKIGYAAIVPVGTSVVISGMAPSGYNGTYVVTASTSGFFSYALATNPGTATTLGTATVATYDVPMNYGRARINYYIGQTATNPATGYGVGGYGDGGYGTGVVYSGAGRTYTSVGIVGDGTTAEVDLGTDVYVKPGSLVTVSLSTNFDGSNYEVLTAQPDGTFTFASTTVATNTGASVTVTAWGFEMPDPALADWTLDNWGEYMVASPIKGEVFFWNPKSESGHAVVMPNAPLVNEGFFVAMPERQVIAYGSTFTGFQDPLLIRWCDVGNFTSWVGTVVNQAGSYRIPKGSKIVGGIQGPQQGLIWTDLGLWAMQYINLPLVYSFNEIAAGCGLIAQKAVGTLAGTVYWMSQSQFFRLSGAGVEPVNCPIWDVIFQDIDTDYSQNIRCAPNSRFGEITWYYPTRENIGTDLEGVPTNYVKYNALLGQWDYGVLTRTAWIDQSVNGPPIGSGPVLDPQTQLPVYNIYQHETSPDADGSAINAWFQTGYFAIQDGDLKTFVDQVWPDMKWALFSDYPNAVVTISFYTADYPGETPRVYPYVVSQNTTFVTPRFRSRLVSIRIESNDIGSFWRLGNIRYRYQPDGKF